MNAVISGRTGVALLVDGRNLASIHRSAPDQLTPCQTGSFERLFSDALDLVFLAESSVDEIRQRFRLECARTHALDLILIVLDPELSPETRNEAAEEFEASLPAVGELVLAVLCSQPVPESADLSGALKMTNAPSLRGTHNLLNELQGLQATIGEIQSLWDGIPARVFGTQQARDQARAIFVREGLFRNLVLTRANGTALDSFILDGLIDSQIHALHNYRAILSHWVNPFRSQRAPTVPQLDVPDSEEDEADGRHAFASRRFDREAAISSIDRQKEAIIKALQSGHIRRARAFVEDLVGYQVEHGGLEYACKSLCDLAKESQNLRMYEFQLELTTKAVGIQPDDSWALTQHAKALHNVGQLGDALETYQIVIDMNEKDIVPRNGRADVLKALGRLPEALAAYEETIKEFPEEVWSKNGHAEVLKVMNRLPEALAAYEEAIAKFSGNIMSRNGRAEVLKVMNRLPEALAAYEETIEESTGEVAPKSGRAEVLKVMNRLPEALAAYEEAIKEFPREVVPKCGRAEVLKVMNRLPEALAAYEEIIRQHPNEVIPKNGHAEVLKAMDRLPEALTAYEEIIRQHPNEVVTKNGRAEVLKAMNRLPEALAAYRSNLALYPYAERTRCGLACVLAAMGKWDEALAELPDKDPVTPAEWVAYHIRGMILLRTGSPELAVQIFERGAQSNPRPAARDYFRTALAVARIKQGNPSLATPILVEVESAALKVPANRILVHAFGAQGQTENAAHAYRGLTQPRFGPILELSEELRRRYVDLQEPRHSEEWLTFREIDCLLLAA